MDAPVATKGSAEAGDGSGALVLTECVAPAPAAFDSGLPVVAVSASAASNAPLMMAMTTDAERPLRMVASVAAADAFPMAVKM